MKNVIAAVLAAAAAGVAAGAREVNLINNNSYARGLRFWRYSGEGKAGIVKKCAAFDHGTLSHYLDLGNLEHADPQCVLRF